MNNLSETIIFVYLFVSEHLELSLKGKRLRRGGPKPKLTDAECITIFVISEAIGIDTNVGAWHYINEHWKHFFPLLPSQSQLSKQIDGLWSVLGTLQRQQRSFILGLSNTTLIDGFPVATCRYARAKRVKSFKGEAWFGYCASQKEHYFGFKGHLVTTEHGFIVRCIMTPANISERDASFEALQGLNGLCIGDKGYLGEEYWKALDHMGIFMKTPYRSNMKPDPIRESTKRERGKRRLIETVIGQLEGRFNMSKVRARKMLQHTGRIARKILSHTIFALKSLQMGYPPTKLNQVIPIL